MTDELQPGEARYEYTGDGAVERMKMRMHLQAPNAETMRITIEPADPKARGVGGASIDLDREQTILLWQDLERLFLG